MECHDHINCVALGNGDVQYLVHLYMHDLHITHVNMNSTWCTLLGNK